MATATEGSNKGAAPPSAFDDSGESMKRCKRCDLTYLPSKSSSALKLTYCSFFCELGDLGFSMDSLERMQRREPGEEPPEEEAESPTEEAEVR